MDIVSTILSELTLPPLVNITNEYIGPPENVYNALTNISYLPPLAKIMESYTGTPYSELLDWWYSQTIETPNIPEYKIGDPRSSPINKKNYMKSFNVNNINYSGDVKYTIPGKNEVGIFNSYIIKEGMPFFYASTDINIPNDLNLYFYPRAAELSLFTQKLADVKLEYEERSDEDYNPDNYISTSQLYNWLPAYVTLFTAKTNLIAYYTDSLRFVFSNTKCYGKYASEPSDITLQRGIDTFKLFKDPWREQNLVSAEQYINNDLAMSIDEFAESYIGPHKSGTKRIYDTPLIPYLEVCNVSKHFNIEETYVLDTQDLVHSWMDRYKTHLRKIKENRKYDIIDDYVDFYKDPVLNIKNLSN